MQKRDEWQFLRLRAGQLFEEGDARAALKLVQKINRAQNEKFKNMNKPRIVSTRAQ